MGFSNFNRSFGLAGGLSEGDTKRKQPHAFTMVEVAAALVVLSVLLSSVIALMNRYAEAVMDIQLRDQAFEVARGNMETLLAESKLSSINKYGTSEINPDIEWKIEVGHFNEPMAGRMWIKAVCSAGFNDSKGEYQEVELEHWITNLNPAQIRQILAQEEVEDEYMKLLNDGEDSAMQETTRAYLQEQGLDIDAYDRFAEQQKRKKLKYISENGFDGYEKFVETLEDEEDEFLDELGMDFAGYNQFAITYVPRSTNRDSSVSDAYDDSQPFNEVPELPELPDDPYEKPDDPQKKPDKRPKPSDKPSSNDILDWNKIPRDFWGLFKQLGFDPPE